MWVCWLCDIRCRVCAGFVHLCCLLLCGCVGFFYSISLVCIWTSDEGLAGHNHASDNAPTHAPHSPESMCPCCVCVCVFFSCCAYSKGKDLPPEFLESIYKSILEHPILSFDDSPEGTWRHPHHRHHLPPYSKRARTPVVQSFHFTAPPRRLTAFGVCRPPSASAGDMTADRWRDLIRQVRA
jgi:hypothetical protein